LRSTDYGGGSRRTVNATPKGQFTVNSLTLVLARARNGVIGADGALPWHLREDLQRFKQTTLGHPVVMGRKTWDSILARNGKPLPGRRNVVVSRDRSLVAPGAQVVDSLAAALAVCADAPEVYVIGGAQIYAAALPLAQRALVTEIDADFAGDAVMPPLGAGWHETAREPHGPTAERPWGFAFVTYERR
jgi:dihydrofolate reductase